MLHLQPLIIDRIRRQTQGFVTISNASVLAGLRDIGPLLPACIVQPGAGEPSDNSGVLMPFLEVQDWDATIIVAHQSSQRDHGQTEQVAGCLMQAVVQALHRWSVEQPAMQHQPFRYTGRDLPYYSAGYAEFTLHFGVKAVIGAASP